MPCDFPAKQCAGPSEIRKASLIFQLSFKGKKSQTQKGPRVGYYNSLSARKILSQTLPILPEGLTGQVHGLSCSCRLWFLSVSEKAGGLGRFSLRCPSSPLVLCVNNSHLDRLGRVSLSLTLQFFKVQRTSSGLL